MWKRIFLRHQIKAEEKYSEKLMVIPQYDRMKQILAKLPKKGNSVSSQKFKVWQVYAPCVDYLEEFSIPFVVAPIYSTRTLKTELRTSGMVSTAITKESIALFWFPCYI